MDKKIKRKKMDMEELTKVLKIKDIELSSQHMKKETFVLDSELSISLKALSKGCNIGKSSLLRIALYEFTQDMFKCYPELKKIRSEMSKMKGL